MANQFSGHLAIALSDFGKLQIYVDDPQARSFRKDHLVTFIFTSPFPPFTEFSSPLL